MDRLYKILCILVNFDLQSRPERKNSDLVNSSPQLSFKNLHYDVTNPEWFMSILNHPHSVASYQLRCARLHCVCADSSWTFTLQRVNIKDLSRHLVIHPHWCEPPLSFPHLYDFSLNRWTYKITQIIFRNHSNFHMPSI